MGGRSSEEKMADRNRDADGDEETSSESRRVLWNSVEDEATGVNTGMGWPCPFLVVSVSVQPGIYHVMDGK